MRSLSISLLFLGLIVTIAGPVRATERWLDDTCISTTPTGMDRVFLDVKEDDSYLYALVSGNQTDDRIGWYNSTNGGLDWSLVLTGTWQIDNTYIGGAYGFDVFLAVWQTYGAMYRMVIDPVTGTILHDGDFVNELPLIARDIAVDSNAETVPGDESRIFLVCATLIDPGTDQVTLKAYRSNDLGVTWTHPTLLDQGPEGDPGYIGDMSLSFSVAGFPYFHVVYEKGGRLWHVRTANAGVSWGTPTELVLNVNPAGAVSVAAFGIYAIAVGESPTGQVVYCHTTDAGASWSSAMLIDGIEEAPRLPSVSHRGSLYHAVYRTSDGRLAERHTAYPDDPSNWSEEEFASVGTTDVQPSVQGIGVNNAGVVYARLDDDGRPYFVSRSGVPSSVDLALSSIGGHDLRVFPTPSSGPVAIVYSGPEGRASAVPGEIGSVVDVSGRVIRKLWSTGHGGQGIISGWDGRDTANRRVPPGIYYVRVSTPAGIRSTPVLIVR